MNHLQTFLARSALFSQKFFLICAIVFMIGFTVVQHLKYVNQPLQIQGLAGREVSTEKIADVFLRMDELALRQHYLYVWTFNGIIFLSTLLLLCGRSAPKK